MSVGVSEVVVALSRVVYVAQPAPLEERLLASGWVQGEPGSAGLNRTWRSGDTFAIQYGRGQYALVEVTMEVCHPNPDDLDNEEELLGEFEAKFASVVFEVRSTLGDGSFVGAYDDPGFPEDVDAVGVAEWRHGDSRLAVNLKHEDLGLPFRITMTAS